MYLGSHHSVIWQVIRQAYIIQKYVIVCVGSSASAIAFLYLETMEIVQYKQKITYVGSYNMFCPVGYQLPV